jgi:hypothetical protein
VAWVGGLSHGQCGAASDVDRMIVVLVAVI